MKLPQKITLLFLLLSCVFQGIKADTPDDAPTRFKQANDLYASKKYDEAIKIYQSLLDDNYVSAELYFNLGNAYFKMDKIAPAILYYERAKKLDPKDEDIAFNLKIANLRVVDKIEPIPEIFIVKVFKKLTGSLTANQWAIIMVTMIWIAFIFSMLFVFSRIAFIKRLGFFGAVFFFVACYCFLLFFLSSA